MLKVNKVHQAVLVAMSAGTASSALHAQAIEEITVTATKRAASMQDVALAVQAMDSQALEDQNIQSFTPEYYTAVHLFYIRSSFSTLFQLAIKALQTVNILLQMLTKI